MSDTRDEFDEIAIRVLWFGNDTAERTASAFASAFRAAAAQKSCLTCAHYCEETRETVRLCTKGIVGIAASVKLETRRGEFSCSLYQSGTRRT